MYRLIPGIGRNLRRAPPLMQSSHFAATPSAVPLSRLSESFASGTSSNYLDAMHDAWRKDPSSVHVSWAAYFEQVAAGALPGAAHAVPGVPTTAAAPSGASGASAAALDLIRAYEDRGHWDASVNPLQTVPLNVAGRSKLELERFGLRAGDRVTLPAGLAQDLGIAGGSTTAGELEAVLRTRYCSDMSAEFAHITDPEERSWLRRRMGTARRSLAADERREVLWNLVRATEFERFLQVKFTVKRFGLDGAESLIPGMQELVSYTSRQLGVGNIVFGMPHRGRLNVLANVMQKPLEVIFHEFDSSRPSFDDHEFGSGDMKYHYGTACSLPNVNLSLAANPSHLDAVNPVVMGKTYAKMRFEGDVERKRSLAVLLHGDASFAAQGIVQECFDLSSLRNFHVGGVIHIVVNNQIGFTTDFRETKRAEASPYCTEVAKMAGSPILHVNGENPEAVCEAMRVAADFRSQFGRDVVIDIVAYRRYGHNELDQPAFTQPLMYKEIAAKKVCMEAYNDRLVAEGAVGAHEMEEMIKKVRSELDSGLEKAKTHEWSASDWSSTNWDGFEAPELWNAPHATAISDEEFDTVAKALVTVPSDLKLHKTVAKTMRDKKKMIETGKGIDWATAEALAFGTIAMGDNFVRLTGEDVQRGTFSHRHAVLVDQETGKPYMPLHSLEAGKRNIEVCNSNLSEYGVLGFELGVSLERKNSLVLWEAQFGDFANGAQIIIDQFLASGEAKWNRQSGLVMLLPHGYDGLGPEHSSARLERFLQLSNDADDDVRSWMVNEEVRTVYQSCNLQVCNITSPANYFHALRRQIVRDFRKPLVIMAPKRGLREPLAVSNREDFILGGGAGSNFRAVLPEPEPEKLVDPKDVRRVLMCSGNVFFDLLPRRAAVGAHDVAIVRLEQIAPFPHDCVAEALSEYPNAEVVWVQEEPHNMGAWSYVENRINTDTHSANRSSVRYIGRPPSASTATGSATAHKAQLEAFLTEAFE